jgi:predicted small integral membrane protein
MLLICFNNLTDYWSNFSFVQNVTGMEGVFSKEQTGWRSIQHPALHHISYMGLILFELSTALILLTGSISLIRNYKASPMTFNQSKKWVKTGMTMGFILFFGFFISIAGEWFLMWQQTKWNAQGTAFSLSILFLAGLLFIDQDK